MVNSDWGKIVRGLRQDLSQDERYAVADHVVSQLEERGDPWGLDEEAKARTRTDHLEFHFHDSLTLGYKRTGVPVFV